MESTHTMLEGETIQGVLSKIWFHSIQFFFFNFSTNQKLWHHLGCRAVSTHFGILEEDHPRSITSKLIQFGPVVLEKIKMRNYQRTDESWSKNMKNSNSFLHIGVRCLETGRATIHKINTSLNSVSMNCVNNPWLVMIN